MSKSHCPHCGEPLLMANFTTVHINQSLDELNNTVKESNEKHPPAPTIEVGDFIRGSWRDPDTGKTYYSEGIVNDYPAGKFVDQKNGGTTPLSMFFHISEITKA